MKNYTSRITERLLYLYVFLLPWQTRWIIKEGQLNGGTWEYGTYSLYATDLLFLLLIFFHYLGSRKDTKESSHRPARGLDISIIAILVIAALSFFWSLNQGLTLYVLTRLVMGGVLVWLIGGIKFRLRRLAQAFVGGALIQAIIGLAQFFSQTALTSKWLGWASHDPGQLGTFVVETDGQRLLRAYGGLPHPNILAGLLVIAILFIFGLYFDLYHRIRIWFERIAHDRKRKFWSKHRPEISRFTAEIMFYLLSLIFCMFGLIVTFSRSAWLALAVALAVLALVVIIKSDKVRLITFSKLFIVILLVAGVALALFREPIFSRFQPEHRLEQISIESRQTYQEQAVQLLKKHWIVGVGLGTYTQAVHDGIDTRLKPWDYQPVHNIYLLLAGELSFFGLLALGFLLFEILRKTVKKLFSDQPIDHWFMVAVSQVAVLFVFGLFDHFWWTLNIGIMLWWLVIGVFRKSAIR
ncbi:MAG: O-antigen ligase family protein [Patescibacteria group bacterium]|nr:O-antigen ligase family protein [Patescibacteria group bacterium]